ncbi:MAG: 16S rRNA (uracil(1498)-N(3))-methyltransferase, partial [Bacteroidales bacterium]
MNLFYTPDITDGLYSLNEEESRHCRMVLRLREGDIVNLTDGKGTLFEARIMDARSRQVTVEVISRQDGYGRRNYRLHIAVAPTKNIDRFEWFLEKATEIGVDEITPLICDHSERRQLRTDRLEKVITAAVKQSLKAYHPKLNEPEPLGKFLENPHPGDKYMAYITSGAPLLKQLYQKGADAVILIGPEGDFSPAEVEAAIKCGYQVISLGESRLRTETAAVVACH